MSLQDPVLGWIATRRAGLVALGLVLLVAASGCAPTKVDCERTYRFGDQSPYRRQILPWFEECEQPFHTPPTRPPIR